MSLGLNKFPTLSEVDGHYQGNVKRFKGNRAAGPSLAKATLNVGLGNRGGDLNTCRANTFA